jgi:glutaredoxin-related protein
VAHAAASVIDIARSFRVRIMDLDVEHRTFVPDRSRAGFVGPVALRRRPMTTPSNPRPLLGDEHTSDHVRAQISSFHADIVTEVSTAVARDAVVVVGMATNPFVKKARAALTTAGIEFTYLEYGSYTKHWKQRLAIKLWSGHPTFPQVFVRGSLIGGFTELTAALADGSLATRLAA